MLDVIGHLRQRGRGARVHLQFCAPVTLKVGQGIYIDSTMGHAYVAKDCESAFVLAVCSSEDLDLASELPGLTGNESQEPAAPASPITTA